MLFFAIVLLQVRQQVIRNLITLSSLVTGRMHIVVERDAANTNGLGTTVFLFNSHGVFASEYFDESLTAFNSSPDFQLE